jgi:hypothetical protein
VLDTVSPSVLKALAVEVSAGKTNNATKNTRSFLIMAHSYVCR